MFLTYLYTCLFFRVVIQCSSESRSSALNMRLLLCCLRTLLNQLLELEGSEEKHKIYQKKKNKARTGLVHTIQNIYGT